MSAVFYLLLSFLTPCATEDSHMCHTETTVYLWHAGNLAENDRVPAYEFTTTKGN